MCVRESERESGVCVCAEIGTRGGWDRRPTAQSHFQKSSIDIFVHQPAL